jgi:hypothetical protein
VELIPTGGREQIPFFSGKPGIPGRILVKGMLVDFLSCPCFLFTVNKQPVVPVFIMLMLLNNYAEPEIYDGLCIEGKTALGCDRRLLVHCGFGWIIKYLSRNNR